MTEPVRLRHDPAALRPSYASARPFPHAVIDDLFEDSGLEQVLAAFPRPETTKWISFDSPTEKKLGFHHQVSQLDPIIRRFLMEMNSFEMLSFLETVTGIDGLIPDPYFGGGGIHQILPGGFLKVHADFNVHPKLKLDRRLNMLIYLNKDWKEEYGGHLELWDPEMKGCVRSVRPDFNRTVIFSTTDTSFHGHPTPLAVPEGMTRKSVSLYYYTSGRPSEERSAAHDTIFRKRSEGEW